MLNRYSLLSVPMLTSIGLLAQPTLTTTTSVPFAPSDVEVRTANSYLAVSPGGADVDHAYWDMLSPQAGTRNIFYRAASITPTSASIPSATLLSTDGGSDTLFWAVTAQGLEQVGVRADLEGVINFSDAALELELPCTYNTSWSDAVAATYIVGGIIPVTRVGTVTGLADAYGTLAMPNGVVLMDVLRVKLRRDITDNSAAANVHRIANVYRYFTESVAHPILMLSEDSTQIGAGAWTVTRSAQWQGAQFTIGMDELTATADLFTAYPNPAVGLVDLAFAANGRDVRSVEVVNAAGQVVMQYAMRVTSAQQMKGAFDVSTLDKGVYYVRVNYADGGRASQALVVR